MFCPLFLFAVVSSQLSNPSDIVSSDITYLWDGDSRTVWVPHLDDKVLKVDLMQRLLVSLLVFQFIVQFQLHLGSLHVVEELMLMGDIDGSLSLMFATHDGSLPEKKYGPISTHIMVGSFHILLPVVAYIAISSIQCFFNLLLSPTYPSQFYLG